MSNARRAKGDEHNGKTVTSRRTKQEVNAALKEQGVSRATRRQYVYGTAMRNALLRYRNTDAPLVVTDVLSNDA